MSLAAAGLTAAVGAASSYFGGKSAKNEARRARKAQMKMQQKAMDFQREMSNVPRGLRDEALANLGDVYGFGSMGYDDTGKAVFGDGMSMGDVMQNDPYYQAVAEYGEIPQDALISRAESSPLYGAIMSGMGDAEEAIMRNAAATGGLRGGNTQDALARQAQNLQANALLQSYNQQLGQYEGQRDRELTALKGAQSNYLTGLHGLAGMPTGAEKIPEMMERMGQTTAQGYTAQGQITQDMYGGIGNSLMQGLGMYARYGNPTAQTTQQALPATSSYSYTNPSVWGTPQYNPYAR